MCFLIKCEKKDFATKTTKIILDAVINLYNVIKFCESLKRWFSVNIVCIMKFFITKKYNSVLS